MIRTGILAFLLVPLTAATPVLAQEAPPPRKMPRVPVTSQLLQGGREPVPVSHEVQGSVAVIDAEKIRINKTDLRLFGIVPPQLSASFGPQARAYLDALVNGLTITCKIRDRDRDGRLLATCLTPAGSDIAQDLLRRGYAVAARGSVAGTELAGAYVAAERAAQVQRLGVWSLAAQAAAQQPATPIPTQAAAPSPAVAAQVAAVAPLVASALRPTEVSSKKADPAPETTKADPETKKEDPAKAPPPPPPSQTEAQLQAKVAADILSDQEAARLENWPERTDDNIGFFERYQLLISCLLMLTTAMGIANALRLQRKRDRREELKALAAALRGELMAARSICHGRAKSISTEEEDNAAVWPRIRSTLYQAYVGRLGMLGADLSRQIASIYGQSGDYAAFYAHAATGTPSESPKKHALETLLKHIDDVLPRLAEIERTGIVKYRLAIAPPAPVPPAPHHKNAQTTYNATATSLTESEIVSHAVGAHAYAASETQSTSVSALATSLWNAVCGLMPAPAAPPEQPLPPLPQQFEAQVADYTAMIEADMERYHSIGMPEPNDYSHRKSHG